MSSPRFQIKICGITTAKDARLCALAGADALGLNFYSESPRSLDLEAARQIIEVIPPKITKVGVFVNASADQVEEFATQLSLDVIQLHGDEPPDFLVELPAETPIIRAFRCQNNGFASIASYLDHCRSSRMPDAILLDAAKAGHYGGTGVAVDWNAVRDSSDRFANLPIILAGGLTPFNVAEAISIVHPEGVDVASGVESRVGTKDLLMVRAFVAAAKKAFSE